MNIVTLLICSRPAFHLQKKALIIFISLLCLGNQLHATVQSGKKSVVNTITPVLASTVTVIGTLQPFVGDNTSAIAPQSLIVKAPVGTVVRINVTGNFEIAGKSADGIYYDGYAFTADSAGVKIYVRPRAGIIGDFTGYISFATQDVFSTSVNVAASIGPRPDILISGAADSTLTVDVNSNSVGFAFYYYGTARLPDKYSITPANGIIPGFEPIIDAYLPPVGTQGVRSLVVPFKPLPAGVYYLNLVVKNSSTGATSGIHRIILKVQYAPFNTAGTLTPFNTGSGRPSNTQMLTIQADSLSRNINIVAPDGFEVSLDGRDPNKYPVKFSQTLSYTGNSLVSPTTNAAIYVRKSASKWGYYTGNIVIKAGDFSGTVPVNGNVVDETVDAVVDSVISMPGSPSRVSVHVQFKSGFANQFSMYSYPRQMPGFEGYGYYVPLIRHTDANGMFLPGYWADVPLPANVTPGTYDFTLSLLNTYSTFGRDGFRIVYNATGLTDVTPPKAMTVDFGSQSNTSSLIFTAKGLATSKLSFTVPDAFLAYPSVSSTVTQGVYSINQTNGVVGPVIIYLSLKPGIPAGNYSGNINFYDGPGNLIGNIPIPVSTVNPQPIGLNPTSGNYIFHTQLGHPSAINGPDLYVADTLTNVSITVPTGFEVALQSKTKPVDLTWAKSVTFNGHNFTPATNGFNVFVRLTGDSVGTRSGLMLVSANGVTKSVQLSGTVYTDAFAAFIGDVGVSNLASKVTFTVSYILSAANKFSMVAGPRAMPGFTPITDGLLYDTVNPPDAIQASGHKGDIPLPKNVPPGSYDFNVTFKSTVSGQTSNVYHMLVGVLGIGTVKAPSAMTTTYSIPSDSTSFTFMALGVKATYLQLKVPDGFEMSPAPYNQWFPAGQFMLFNTVNGAVPNTRIAVRLAGKANVGTHTGDVVFYDNGLAVFGHVLIPASTVLPLQMPTQSSYHLTFNNITTSSATVSWTNGNGAARAVFISKTTGGVAAPVQSTTYTANAAFGAGTQIGSTGWYCVYKGSGSSVNLTGLTAGTYRVTVVDYNGGPGGELYLTSGLAPANCVIGAQTPTSQANRVAFTNTTATGATISWTNGNGTLRAVFIAQTQNGVAVPADNTHYNANATFGSGTQVGASGWYCIYNGAGSSANVTGLNPNTGYRVTVVEYNGDANAEKYMTTNLAPANTTTLPLTAIPPTQSAYHLNFNNTTVSGTTVNWTNGNGAARAVFVALTNNGAAIPAAKTHYNANTVFGAGTQIGTTGWYCVYNGTASSANISGLLQNTTYRVTVVEYNGTSGGEQYIGTGLSPASVTTATQTPTSASYHLTFTGITQNSATVSWTNGNGSNRAVFVSPTSSGVAAPVNNTHYIANATLGSGTGIVATSWYCVYNGSGSSATINGLQAGTTYRVTVVDYNGNTGTELYLTGGLSPANVTTLPAGVVAPTVYASHLTFTDVSFTSATISWTNGNGAKRAVFIAQANSGYVLPVNNTTYTANINFGSGTQINGWYCIYNGTGSGVSIASLSPGLSYRVTVIDYNGAAGNEKYLTSAMSPASFITPTSLGRGVTPDALRNSMITNGFDSKVEASNILSPNGDGKNDTWQVSNLELYPHNTVTVYNAAGETVFNQKGYDNSWNGHNYGSAVSRGTYYYLIDLGNGTQLRGFITVL